MDIYIIGILIGIIVFIAGFLIGMRIEKKHNEQLFEIALGGLDMLNEVKDELIKFYKDDSIQKYNSFRQPYYSDYRKHYSTSEQDEESE